MDLLEEENKVQKSSKKKVVLMLLIVSIVLLILSLIMIYALQGTVSQKEKLIVNGQDVEIKADLIVSDANQNKYISLRGLADLIKYNYYNGTLFEVTEDKDKCYMKNQKAIVGFEANSNKIYKTEENSLIECQYYELKNKILQHNNNLYINLEDLQQACNVVVKIEQTNQIRIDTPSDLITKIQKEYDDKKINNKLDISANSERAISYNMLVVSINNKYGVLDRLNPDNTVISTKYDSLDFAEYSQTFIASNNKKYGIISKEGKGIIDLIYDDISIINYDPILYKVKQNNKYGVIGKTGEIIVALAFDQLGFENKDSNNTTINSLLIIKEIDDGEDGIIISSNGKYGVANLSNGKIFLDCNLDKIYSKLSETNEQVNYVQFNGNEYTLEAYIKYVNTITVVNNTEKPENEENTNETNNTETNTIEE